jgi:hypothetical protein
VSLKYQYPYRVQHFITENTETSLRFRKFTARGADRTTRVPSATALRPRTTRLPVRSERRETDRRRGAAHLALSGSPTPLRSWRGNRFGTDTSLLSARAVGKSGHRSVRSVRSKPFCIDRSLIGASVDPVNAHRRVLSELLDLSLADRSVRSGAVGSSDQRRPLGSTRPVRPDVQLSCLIVHPWQRKTRCALGEQ